MTIPATALLCVVLETEMFTLNLSLQAKTFLRPNFTTRTTNIQTLGLNLTNLKKHRIIKNERRKDWTTGILYTQTFTFICLTIQRDILPKQLRITIDKCEFKHKHLKLIISGSYCPLKLFSVCGEEEEEEAAVHVCHSRHKG